MKSSDHYKAALWVTVFGVMLTCLLTGCGEEPAGPVSERKDTGSRQALKERIASYQALLCRAKKLEARKFLCPDVGQAHIFWNSYFPMGSVCHGFELEAVEEGSKRGSAVVESIIEQDVYPPKSASNPLRRWLTVRESWERVQGEWCVKEGKVVGMSLKAPETRLPSKDE